jgi:hypothetical protein
MLNTQNDLSDDDESFRKTISEIDELGVLIDDPKSIVANSQDPLP